MDLFRDSLVKKLIIKLFLFAVLLVVVYFFLVYQKVDVVYTYFFLGGVVFFMLLFVLVYVLDVIRPLRAVLFQMQLLLTGKQYKRVYTERIDEVGIIAHFFNQFTKGLGTVSDDLKDRDRMMDELNIASKIQRDILPLHCPNVKGLQIVAKTKPATEVGGDSFNVFTLKNNTFVYIGDVTGHGVAAGLIMSMVNSLISVFAELYDSPYKIVVKVNKFIKRHIKGTMFMTMVLLRWDQEKAEMSYVGAGHEYILVYRAGSGECESIMAGGVAIGMVPDNSGIVSEKKIPLEDGDVVLLYTDGITEARNVAGELYGLERLKEQLIEFGPQYSAEGINYHIARNVSGYMNGHVQDDDMTLIVMKKDASITVSDPMDVQSTDWQEEK